MIARDIMVSPVITVKVTSSVADVAATLLSQGIGAVPVVDDKDSLVGIVSEGDLLRAAGQVSDRPRALVLRALTADGSFAHEYARAQSRKIVDVMTRRVITAAPDEGIVRAAALLNENAIKRLPIVADRRLVGIVSRTEIVRAMATDLGKIVLGELKEALSHRIPPRLPRKRGDPESR